MLKLLYRMLTVLFFFYNVPASAAPMEFGFTQHFKPFVAGSSLTLAQSKKNIDAMASSGVKWFRMNATAEIEKYTSPDVITFKASAMAPTIELFRYAQSKGLKVYLNTNPLFVFKKTYKLSESEFLRATKTQYNYLVRTFPTAEVWQVYNEANWYGKDDYILFCSVSPCPNNLPDLTSSYMTELYNAISVARSAIRAVAPSAKLTTNSAGLPWGNNRLKHREMLKAYFDRLMPVIDIVAMDFYPTVDEVIRLQEETRYFKSIYGDKFWIAEIGRSSRGENRSPWDQEQFFSAIIPALAETGIKNVLLYEFQDSDYTYGADSDPERHYGLIDRNLYQKRAYQSTMSYVNLFSSFELSKSNLPARSKAVVLLSESYLSAFGRYPQTWEIYNANGWVDSLVLNPRSKDSIVAGHLTWLKNNPKDYVKVIHQTYQSIFGRAPSQFEANQWSQAAVKTYDQISAEHVKWLNSNNGRYEKGQMIDRAYATYLKRAAYTSEYDSWMNSYIKSNDVMNEQFRDYMDVVR